MRTGSGGQERGQIQIPTRFALTLVVAGRAPEGRFLTPVGGLVPSPVLGLVFLPMKAITFPCLTSLPVNARIT